MQTAFDGYVLPLDEAVVFEWARVLAMHPLNRKRATDAFLAATARLSALTIITRNTKDFEHMGVHVSNPFN